VNKIIPLLLAVVLAGCADLSVAPTMDIISADSWNVRQSTLARLRAWVLTGRLAIQTESEGWTATLHWIQDDENYNMRFIAPLGQGTYELNGDVHKVSMLTADNRFLQAADPESLMLDNLGWNVPLKGLKYWIRGLPEPGIVPDSLILDDKGRVTDMQQSGWHISILRYAEVEGIDLPGKLYMQNDRFKLRLVIQDWKTTS